jgi:hypothetical protein
MTTAVVVGVLGINGGTIPSHGEDLSGDNKMSKDSGNDDNEGSGGGVRDKKGGQCQTMKKI